ncbi:IclR family transcriptional regulator [Microbacterium allomyrinae]|uniref:IclR family transcriptional regulator n=1 Tax=Microbacterium allomyrinae TaxID=2830666 RepID=A0A9X1S0L6_9MICO|nr:IclR family transcriptional regulator [Microbacterium allomyrinae]MCC2030716.1 IclR family transcriptional regulator [Microbacterium allomyrinae]
MTEDQDDRTGRDPAPAVTRSIRLLDLLAQRGTMTLTELAGGLSLAKSSTANLCLALEAADMVERVAQGYRLGRRTAELGGAYAAQFQQVREFYAVCDASPVLRHELVQVAMLDGADALYLARHEGNARVRLGTPLGSRLPAALSATGRALLMAYDDARVGELLADRVPFPKLTDNSPTDLSSLLERLADARERGWALDSEESYPGIVGVAVPLEPWAPGDPQLALGVGMAAAGTETARIERVATALKEAAAQLTNPFSDAAKRGPRTR